MARVGTNRGAWGILGAIFPRALLLSCAAVFAWAAQAIEISAQVRQQVPSVQQLPACLALLAALAVIMAVTFPRELS